MPNSSDKKFWGLIILVGFVLFFITLSRVGWLAATPQRTTPPQQVQPLATATPVPTLYPSVASTPDHGRTSITIRSQVLEIEVVNTSESVTQGLSGRSAIGADGMLFVFTQSMMPRFWMKEMQFPLDMIWINNQKIVDITENVPAPEAGQSLQTLPTYGPSEPVNWVLEVPAGTVAKHGWQVGDMVTTEDK